MKLGPYDALIVVDVQRDFCPGGALAVPEGDRVVPVLNEYIALFQQRELPIIATRDWHPPDHVSFKEHGGIWPSHCVRDTEGAQFHPELKLPDSTIVISKATERDKEAYSGFEGTELERMLRDRNVRRVFVGGLATDYCVKSTVLDALNHRFTAFLLEDAVRGVDVNPGDSDRAIDEMLNAGAIIIALAEVQ